MASIRHRLHRLESRTAGLYSPLLSPVVHAYIPDNGRGAPGPGTYRCGPAALTVYPPGCEDTRTMNSRREGAADAEAIHPGTT